MAKSEKSTKSGKSDAKRRRDAEAASPAEIEAVADEQAVAPEKPAKPKKDKQGKKTKKDKKAKKAEKAGKDAADASAQAETAEAPTPPEQPKKSKKSKKSKKKSKQKEKAEKSGKKAKRAEKADQAERDADRDGFARLVPVIHQLVALVELHDPAVRRSVFDAYVSAIVDGGAAMTELAPLDVRSGSVPDGAEGFEPETDEEFETEPDEPANADDRADSAAASGDDDADDPDDAAALAAAGIGGDDDVLPDDDGAPKGRYPAFEGEVIAASSMVPAEKLPTHRTLRGVADQAPPSNNDQRNIVIATWLVTRGHEATPRAVAAGYERMGWRVPVNIGASLRQTVRKGLLGVADDQRLFVTRAGAAHFG